MNCESFSSLLTEVPQALWSPLQQASVDQHCLSCKDCATLLHQEQQLLAVFENMSTPEPTTAMQLQFKPQVQPANSWPAIHSRGLSFSIALFLCLGSAVQLFRESGFSWYWFADGRRLESVITLLYHTPLLSLALIILGLVYCLALNTQTTPGNYK
jgi:hypothetical protein